MATLPAIHRSSPPGDADLNHSWKAARRRVSASRRLSRLAVRRTAGVVALCLVLSSCFVLKQNETFAIGTETNRLNLVIFVDWTGVLDEYRVQNGSTKTRNLVLEQTPQSISLSAGQKALACTLSAAACAAGPRWHPA